MNTDLERAYHERELKHEMAERRYSRVSLAEEVSCAKGMERQEPEPDTVTASSDLFSTHACRTRRKEPMPVDNRG